MRELLTAAVSYMEQLDHEVSGRLRVRFWVLAADRGRQVHEAARS